MYTIIIELLVLILKYISHRLARPYILSFRGIHERRESRETVRLFACGSHFQDLT